MQVQRALVALASFIVVPVVAADVVLFDNFGEDDAYINAGGWSIGSPQYGFPEVSWHQGNGIEISGDADYALSTVTAAITAVTGLNQATLSVYASSEYGSPGQLLESVTKSNLPLLGWNMPPTAFTFSGDTILEAGKRYWVIASAPIGSTMVWNQNSTLDLGLFARKRAGEEPWSQFDGYTRGAMRINATPVGLQVPAPAALWLLWAGMSLRTRRRRDDAV
jgi:hypothetical protein